jgi:hypothetical protein
MSQDQQIKIVCQAVLAKKARLPKAEIFDAFGVMRGLLRHQFYCYIQFRPDNSPFYVGKGKGNRYTNWELRNVLYLKTLKTFGIENIKTVIFPVASEQEAFQWEIQLIYELRSNEENLVNMTDGGEGYGGLIPHQDAVEKMRKTRIRQEACVSLEERERRNEYISHRMSLLTPDEKQIIYNKERNKKVSESLKNKPDIEKQDIAKRGWETRYKNDTPERAEKRRQAAIRIARQKFQIKPAGSPEYKEQGKRSYQTLISKTTPEQRAITYAKGWETRRKREALEKLNQSQGS